MHPAPRPSRIRSRTITRCARSSATNPVRATVSEAATGRPIQFDFTTRHLSAVLRFASYNDDQAALLPLSLHLAAHEENYMPLANQFRVFARSLEEAFAYGMHNSVACSEDTPLIERAKLDLRRARTPRTWARSRCNS